MTGMPMCPKPTETWLSADMRHTSLSKHTHTISQAHHLALLCSWGELVVFLYSEINSLNSWWVLYSFISQLVQIFAGNKVFGLLSLFSCDCIHTHPHLLLQSFWLRVSELCRLSISCLSDDVFPVWVLRLGSLFVRLFILSMYVCVFLCTAVPLCICVCAHARLCLSGSFPEKTHFPSRSCQAVSGCTQFTAGGYRCHLLT